VLCCVVLCCVVLCCVVLWCVVLCVVRLREGGLLYLNMSFGALGAGVYHGLSIEDASRIQVFSRIHVIEGSDNSIQVLPELLVEGLFGLRCHLHYPRLDIRLRIHLFDCSRSNLRFGFL